MSPEAQRIAIAEACGWTKNRFQPDRWYHQDAPQCQDGQYCDEDELPDYLSDLNAMHEAEKVLTEEQLELMCAHLLVIVNPTRPFPALQWDTVRHMFHATAAQRAEAFLRAKGLWRDAE